VVDDVRRRAGRKAKRKGNNFERRVAKMLEEWWGSEFHRTPMSGGSQLAVGFDFAGDVVTNDPTFPFHVEAKNQEGWHVAQVFVSGGCKPYKFWDQACAEAPDSRIPLVIMTRNRHPIWGVVSYDTFSVLQAAIAAHPVSHMDVVRQDGERLVIFLIEELFKTPPDIWRGKSGLVMESTDVEGICSD